MSYFKGLDDKSIVKAGFSLILDPLFLVRFPYNYLG